MSSTNIFGLKVDTEEDKRRVVRAPEYLDWIYTTLVENNGRIDDEDSDDTLVQLISYFSTYLQDDLKVSVYESNEDFENIIMYFYYKGTFFKIETLFGQGACTYVVKIALPENVHVHFFEDSTEIIAHDCCGESIRDFNFVVLASDVNEKYPEYGLVEKVVNQDVIFVLWGGIYNNESSLYRRVYAGKSLKTFYSYDTVFSGSTLNELSMNEGLDVLLERIVKLTNLYKKLEQSNSDSSVVQGRLHEIMASLSQHISNDTVVDFLKSGLRVIKN